MTKTRERTLALIKPGGVRCGLIGLIIQRFEKKGLKLVAMKQVWAPEQRFRQHYSDLATSPNFPALIKYMSSGPVVPMVWEGDNVVKVVRVMIGAVTTCGMRPVEPQPGTIRGDFSFQVGHGTVIHASDSIDAANREINLWFADADKELTNWTAHIENWI